MVCMRMFIALMMLTRCSYSYIEPYILHAIYHLKNFLEIFFVFLKPVCDLLCLISIRNKNFKHEKGENENENEICKCIVCIIHTG